jgi:hypothetical protein
MIPRFLFAGAQRENHVIGEHVPLSERHQTLELPASQLVALQGECEEGSNLTNGAKRQVWEGNGVVHSAKVHRPSQNRKIHSHSPKRVLWSRTGTLILVVGGAGFLLGLLFILIGFGLLSYGLVLLGELLLVLGLIGATVGLVVGLVDM